VVFCVPLRHGPIESVRTHLAECVPAVFLLPFLLLASATFVIEFSMDRALFDGSEVNEWWYSMLLFL
jgi:hypothetical protein